jgi:hypothetical protein
VKANGVLNVAKNHMNIKSIIMTLCVLSVMIVIKNIIGLVLNVSEGFGSGLTVESLNHDTTDPGISLS